jgi:hypothetical protein
LARQKQQFVRLLFSPDRALDFQAVLQHHKKEVFSMNFVVFRNKPGFSFIILFAAFLFIASITIGTVRSSASSSANSQTEKTDVSVDDLKNFSKDEKSGRMSLKSVSHSEENIADSPIFDQFNAWLSSYSDGNFTEAADQLEIGKKLAIKRQHLLKQLIETNPRLALEKSIPAAAFKHLPAEIAEHSEKRVSAHGDFMVYVLEGNDHHTKEMTESRIERFVVIGDDRYEAFVYGRRESMPTKMNIPLQGIIIGDQIALDESPARKIDDSENTAEDFQSKKEGITAEIGGKIVRLSGKTELDDFMRETNRMGIENRTGTPER